MLDLYCLYEAIAIISMLLTSEFKANHNYSNLNDYFEVGILTSRRLIRDKKKVFIITTIFIAIGLLIIKCKTIA